ncbi:YheC/YheD family protein [Metabacillus halosaccharovorans]|uniref:YheC/YheD family protein n=1 Tax=Metabacillus halosaccharovorans TaxID=930124 RepID=UPI000C7FD740|nr:YheC/YheD family protein [Metabacillus halosaccharovorans]MCM3439702.1 YheC/YheD family protein [Metabacillus halosaccharovorans]PMC38581.1 alpha-L-glutamate ligase [Bacillus sp. UMB0899]
MTLIGMLHRRKDPSKVKKAYAYAAIAKLEKISFFYFTYGSVNLEQKKINGWIYENHEWIRKEMDFPDVVINSISPRNEKQRKIHTKLKEICEFTSFPVGNKMRVYKKIKKAKQFSNSIIPSHRVRKGEDVLKYFETQQTNVIKPLSGNHGKKVLFIKSLNDQMYNITDGNQSYDFLKDDLVIYLDHLLSEKKYMLQPYIECKTKNGLTYDLRLHVQKNGKGEWVITLIYPRISGSKRLVSNISSGGYRGELDPFLMEEFGEDYVTIKKIVEQFALSFPKHFDSLYKYDFDELGIDVGIDSHQKLWIFEVNWRPGAKHREFEVAKQLIPYAKYLANNKKNKPLSAG